MRFLYVCVGYCFLLLVDHLVWFWFGYCLWFGFWLRGFNCGLFAFALCVLSGFICFGFVLYLFCGLMVLLINLLVFFVCFYLLLSYLFGVLLLFYALFASCCWSAWLTVTCWFGTLSCAACLFLFMLFLLLWVYLPVGVALLWCFRMWWFDLIVLYCVHLTLIIDVYDCVVLISWWCLCLLFAGLIVLIWLLRFVCCLFACFGLLVLDGVYCGLVICFLFGCRVLLFVWYVCYLLDFGVLLYLVIGCLLLCLLVLIWLWIYIAFCFVDYYLVFACCFDCDVGCVVFGCFGLCFGVLSVICVWLFSLLWFVGDLLCLIVSLLALIGVWCEWICLFCDLC